MSTPASSQGTRRSRAGNAGPFSRDTTLSTIDRRTRAGRVLRSVEADLLKHIGGSATITQRLLVQSAALKATRLMLLSQKLLDHGDLSEGSDHHALAWMNSLRLDLVALGVGITGKGAKAKPDAPSLEAYLAEQAAA